MNGAIKRVTVNLPGDLLEEAESITEKNITDTIIEGLLLIRRRKAYLAARELHGKLDLKIDLDESRERTGG